MVVVGMRTVSTVALHEHGACVWADKSLAATGTHL